MRFNKTRPLTALAMLVAALALAVGFAACGGGSDSTSAEETAPAETSEETVAPGEEEAEQGEEAEGGGTAIQADPENAKVNLTIGSKNFPEQ